jgi:hypothetical protein
MRKIAGWQAQRPRSRKLRRAKDAALQMQRLQNVGQDIRRFYCDHFSHRFSSASGRSDKFSGVSSIQSPALTRYSNDQAEKHNHSKNEESKL